MTGVKGRNLICLFSEMVGGMSKINENNAGSSGGKIKDRESRKGGRLTRNTT